VIKVYLNRPYKETKRKKENWPSNTLQLELQKNIKVCMSSMVRKTIPGSKCHESCSDGRNKRGSSFDETLDIV